MFLLVLTLVSKFKNSGKKIQFFSMYARIELISIMKIACLMLNFLNLESKVRYLFTLSRSGFEWPFDQA